MQQVVIGMMGVKGSGKDTCARYLVEECGFVRIGFADELYRQVEETFGVPNWLLSDRRGKEANLPHLALRHCKDEDFVLAVYEEEELRSAPCSARTVAKMLKVSPGTVRRWARAGRLTATYTSHETGRTGYRLTDVLRQLNRPMVDLLQAPGYDAFLDAPRSPRYILQLWGTEYRRRRGVDSYWLDIVAAAIAAQPSRHFVITDVRFNNEANFVEGLGGVLVRIRRLQLEAKEALERAKRGSAAHPSETELLTRTVSHEVENIEGKPEALREGIFAVLANQAPELV